MYKFLGVILLLISVNIANAATTYYTRVSGGDDSRSCNTATNSATAKKTINGGVSCLSAGDTLLVGAGTYTDVVVWYWYGHQRSGTAQNPITVKSETYRGAIIIPGPAGMGLGLGGGRNIFAFENQNYWTIDGFVTDGSGMSGVIHYNSVGTNGLTIKNGEMKYGADNNSGSDTLGVSTSVGDVNLTIQNNYIHDIGTGAGFGQSFYAYCMYFTASNSLIENNEMSYCSGHGMHMHNTQGSTNNNVMRNNLIHHNGIPGGQAPGVLWAAGGVGNLMYNNVIYANGGSGVRLGGAGAYGEQNTVSFNTIVDNGSEAIIVGSGYCNNLNHIQGNVLVRNTNNQVVLNCSSGNTIDHNPATSANPNTVFVNPTGLNFQLLVGTLAEDAGAIGTGITVDYNGAVRGSPPDAGAYERVAGQSGPLVVYVAPNGDNSRSCQTATSIATPKLTLVSALSCAQVGGSVIYLRAGTYVEQFNTSISPFLVGGSSWSDATKIAAYADEVVTIQHPAGGDEFIIGFGNSNNDHYIILDRLILDGNNIAAKTGLGVWGGAHHIRFQNGVIKNTGWASVAVAGDNVELLNSTFTNVLAAPMIMVGGVSGTLIKGNVISGGDREAIGPNGSGTKTNMEVSGNIIHHTGTGTARAAIVCSSANGMVMFNNIIYVNALGINVQGDCINADVLNNSIYGNVGNGLQIDFGANNTDVKNNIVYGNGGGIVNSGSNTVQLTNLTTNPPFVNPGGGNFQLDASASGAIDVGTTLAQVAVDAIGIPRPYGAGYDIGALEFTGVAQVVSEVRRRVPLSMMRQFFSAR